jgi:uncharacterized membrane protein
MQERRLPGDDADGPMHQPEGGLMADNSVAYVAVYPSVDSALADLDALGELHDKDVVGKYDAAVIDQEDGKPHIVKRVDNPRINVVPELVGKGALPSGKLKDAAKQLDPNEAALIFVGDPTLDKAFDEAVTHASKVAKQNFDSTADDLAKALMNATKAN